MILKQIRVNNGLIGEKTNCYVIQDEKTKKLRQIFSVDEVF